MRVVYLGSSVPRVASATLCSCAAICGVVRRCAGRDAAPCRFNLAQPGRPAQPAPGQGRCCFCDPPRLRRWAAFSLNFRTTMVQNLAKLRRSPEVFRAALEVLRLILPDEPDMEAAARAAAIRPPRRRRAPARGARDGAKGARKGRGRGRGKGADKAWDRTRPRSRDRTPHIRGSESSEPCGLAPWQEP